MSSNPLQGFLFGLLQHLGWESTEVPVSTDVAYDMISVIFLTFGLSRGGLGRFGFNQANVECR
jgi:hypothetical protein